jgi:SAM-dependent methyltransferase
MDLHAVFILVLGSFCATNGTVLLKIGASGRTTLLSFLNGWIVLRLALYGVGAVFWIYGMSRQSLITVYPFTILSFAIVYVVGIVMMGEMPSHSGNGGGGTDPDGALSRHQKRGIVFSISPVAIWENSVVIMDLARKALASATIYDTYQSLIGAPKCHERFIRDMVKPRSGERILDIGCGVGASVRYLPTDISYVGIDISEHYIARARTNYGDRGEFICADAGALSAKTLGAFDRAFSFGVLHHLSNEAAERVVQLVRRVVKPGGTFVTIDPCHEARQHPVAKLLIANDRGEYIRDPVGFERIVAGLGTVRTKVHHNLLRITFSQIVMEVEVRRHT